MTASTGKKPLVDDRMSRLRAIADIDAQAAREAAWALIERWGAGLPGDAAEIELAELFAAGKPAVVDGQTDGMLVGWTTPDADLDRTGRVIHLAAKTVTGLGLMPWLGKKFDRSAP